MRYIVKAWAACLGTVGVLLLFDGAGCTVVGLTGRQPGGADYPPFGSEFYADLREMGVIWLAIGASLVAASVGMWNQRMWGRWLGVGLGAAGLVLTVIWWPAAAVPWALAVFAFCSGLTLTVAVAWYPPVPLGPRSG